MFKSTKLFTLLALLVSMILQVIAVETVIIENADMAKISSGDLVLFEFQDITDQVKALHFEYLDGKFKLAKYVKQDGETIVLQSPRDRNKFVALVDIDGKEKNPTCKLEKNGDGSVKGTTIKFRANDNSYLSPCHAVNNVVLKCGKGEKTATCQPW